MPLVKTNITKVNIKAIYFIIFYTKIMKYFTALILLLLTTDFAHCQQKPFIWADDQDYEPYIYLDEKREVNGIFYDIMTAIFTKMETPLKYQHYPWKRAQKTVNIGHADGMITIPTKIRLETFIASDPITQIEIKVHFNKNNLKQQQISKINSLEQLRSFLIIDYQGDGWAESNLGDYNIAWASNYASAVWMIATSRGDIFFDDPISMKYHIKRQIEMRPALSDKLLLIEQGENLIFSEPQCLLIRKDSPYASMINEFNAALKEIKANGEYDSIISKYIN